MRVRAGVRAGVREGTGGRMLAQGDLREIALGEHRGCRWDVGRVKKKLYGTPFPGVPCLLNFHR